MNLLGDLIEELEKSGKTYDIPQIERAFHTADHYHEGQKRKSGEPYIIHPVAVAKILCELGMDSDTIVAAILHDVVEDTPMTLEEVKSEFGPDVALMVDGVTKITQMQLSTKEEQQAENVRKMLFGMSQDIRVIIIKLCDRLHNMRTMQYQPGYKQREKSLEVMEVFAPIAHRLGIRPVKEELEDYALQYLDPVGYEEIEKALQIRKEQRDEFITTIQSKISERMEEAKIPFHIEGRVKSIYGIYRKVYMQGKSFDEIYDVYAVRIIVDSIFECYNVMGVMHDLFTPLPGRFKDYISTPKPNMYQSLHTTVISKEGIPFEIQIRTWEMHRTAEYGVAAHWKYKAGIQGRDRLEERLSWVRQLLEVQKDSNDASDILRSIKSDLTPDDVFVYTPKGDMKCLPTGATPIDFAYAIHSAVGNRMIGAKIDGKIAPLDTHLHTGEIVEILTTKAQNHGPSRGWLQIAKTSEARNKIRAWFKKERREENIAQGKEEIEQEFKRSGIVLTGEQYQEFIQDIATRQHFPNPTELYAAIGYGGFQLSRVLPRIKDDYLKRYRKSDPPLPEVPVKKKTTHASGGVVVEGLDNCLVKFSRCCNPLPGDDIIGFITRGYGVSIHKQDCLNIAAAMSSEEQRARLVQVYWANEIRDAFKSTIEIVGEDRKGFLADVSLQISNMQIQLDELNARKLKDGYDHITITVTINSLEQLKMIITRFSNLSGVISVRRTGK